MVISCWPDGSCPYQYYCSSSNQCLHNPVFPLQGYPIAIYCLFPIVSAICNTSGNSFASFKIILLMDALDYSESAATTLCYPLILGTALYNFISLIFRRHPQRPTSLVDYNLVMVIIPNTLYGSILGTLLNTMVPPIVANALVLVLTTWLSVNFFIKMRKYHKEHKEEQQKVEVQPKLMTQQIKLMVTQGKDQNVCEGNTIELKLSEGKSAVKQGVDEDEKAKNVKVQITEMQQMLQYKDQISKQQINQQQFNIQKSKSKQNPTGSTSQIRFNPFQKELDQQRSYQLTNHYPHIIATVVFFAFFATCSFLAQGKIVNFPICSNKYLFGMIGLTVLYFLVLIALFQFTKRKMRFYKKIRFQYEYPLRSPRYFTLLCLGAFCSGFISGFVAIGNSAILIFVLLHLDIEPIIATAIVGYQIIFSSAASLLQAISRNTIPLNVVGLFIGLTFVVGGMLSYIVRHFVNKLNKKRVNIVLMAIIGSIMICSAFSMVANITLGFVNFGRSYMLSAGAIC